MSAPPEGTPTVLLVRVGLVDQQVVHGLAASIQQSLGCACNIATRYIDADAAFDPARSQYNSTQLLGCMEAEMSPQLAPGERVLGVTDQDLFIPILTYVFGEAYLEKPIAILSFARLYPQFYGLPKNPDLLMRRATVEAIHELGHTYGRLHCAEPDCAMHASRVADEIDLKGPGFCEECAESLGKDGLSPLRNSDAMHH